MNAHPDRLTEIFGHPIHASTCAQVVAESLRAHVTRTAPPPGGLSARAKRRLTLAAMPADEAAAIEAPQASALSLCCLPRHHRNQLPDEGGGWARLEPDISQPCVNPARKGQTVYLVTSRTDDGADHLIGLFAAEADAADVAQREISNGRSAWINPHVIG